MPTPLSDRIDNDSLRAVRRPLDLTQYVDGVFEGGGTLGAAYIGSLKLMENAGLWFKRVAGNSAGAITAAMIAAGYTADEVEWLSSDFTPPRISKPATLGTDVSLSPINFLDFLDCPSPNSIDVTSKQKTLLWMALKGEAIDMVLDTEIPIPTRATVENNIVAGIKSKPLLNPLVNPITEPLLRDAINTGLAFMPNSPTRLGYFRLFDTSTLRTQFANAVWDAMASSELLGPLLVFATQFLHEGSVFEGDEFLKTMEKILSVKKVVTFKDLKIPLAVIACNYESKKVLVYNSKDHEDMSVAEAVRRSMSIPLVFQPRKVSIDNSGGNETVIDGGVASNFPVWLYTSYGDKYWPSSSIDRNRPKIGFYLDDDKSAPRRWRAAKAKYQNSVTTSEILKDVVVKKLQKCGLLIPTPDPDVTALKQKLGDYKVLDVLTGYTGVDKELVIRDQAVNGLMRDLPYFDIKIPVDGFHWLDFGINSDRKHMMAIAERGYRAALETKDSSGKPLIADTTRFTNPFST